MRVSQLLPGLPVYVTLLHLSTGDVILFLRIKPRWPQASPHSTNMLPILLLLSLASAIADPMGNMLEDDIILTKAQEAALEEGHGEDADGGENQGGVDDTERIHRGEIREPASQDPA